MINNIVNTASASTGGIDIADVVKVIFTIASDTSYIKDAIDNMRLNNISNIEYICDNKLENLHEQEISFFVNKNNFLVNCTIKELSQKVKNVNIITDNPKQFKLLVLYIISYP